MMKRLVVFTTTFPYGSKEPFIENELDYLEAFDEVYYMPLYAEGRVRQINYPSNVKWIRLATSRSTSGNIIRYILRSLVSMIFYKELFLLVKRRELSFRNIYHLCEFIGKGYFYSNEAYKEICKRGLNTSEFYLYSYWMMEHSLAAILLSSKIAVKRMITRVHGYDLYEERASNHYLPCREFILKHIDYVFSISNDGRNYLGKYKAGSILVSRLGTKDHGLAEFSFNNRKAINIVSCSWCVDVKRIDRLIASLALIKDEEVNWTHIGDGPLLQGLVDMSNRILSPNIHVRFLGKMTNDEIIGYYKNSIIDYFINVSASEGIPVSIMEALSFGIPVVATNVGGTPEIVFNAFNGFLLDSNFSIEELASIIESYSHFEIESILAMRKNARLSWEENYSAQKNYSSFYKFITRDIE